jgi:Holliday junction resolvasome RuvABC endonuclease subunit
MNLLSLDVAMVNTGYCIYSVAPKSNYLFKMMEYGTINTDDSLFKDTDSKVRLMLSRLSDIIYRKNINCIVIEEPPQTIYGGNFMNRNQIIGRSVSVMKVCSACYGIIGFCFSSNIFCKTVTPNNWQKANKFSKADSVKRANGVLSYLKFPSPKLTTKQNEHEADAINIGMHAIEMFSSGKWHHSN